MLNIFYNKSRKFSFLLISIFYLLLAAAVPVSADGLVPCNGLDCNACSFFALLKNVINGILTIFVPVIVVMVIIGGFYIMLSNGDTSKVTRGRSIIQKAIIGFAIALLSWLVIDTIISLVASNYGGVAQHAWSQIQCN